MEQEVEPLDAVTDVSHVPDTGVAATDREVVDELVERAHRAGRAPSDAGLIDGSQPVDPPVGDDRDERLGSGSAGWPTHPATVTSARTPS